MPLGALHVLLYKLETAAGLIGRTKRPPLICELIAPRREFVRQRSIISYQDNDSLALRALDATIDRFEESEAWRALLAQDLSDAERSDEAADLIETEFRFSERGGKGSAPHDSDLQPAP